MANGMPDLAARLKSARTEDILAALWAITIRFAAQAEAYAKGNATRKLGVRSGRLRSSLKGKPLLLNRKTFAISLSSDVEYAPTHEFGATIRPKRSKFLTIPVKDELKTAAGVRRYPSARLVPGLTYAKTRRGQHILVHRDTSEVWYVLREQVTVEARPFMRPALKRVIKNISPDIKDALAKVVQL